MRIGFVETDFTVSESETGVPFELRVLDGSLVSELGNIDVTVETRDISASGLSLSLSHTQLSVT